MCCRCRPSTNSPNTQIAPRISMINGVSQVQVMGPAEVRSTGPDRSRQAYRQANRVERHRYRVESMKWNINTPLGTSVRAQDGMQHLRQRPVPDERGAIQGALPSPTSAGDRCIWKKMSHNVIDSVQDDKQASWFPTHEGTDRQGGDLGAKRTVTLGACCGSRVPIRST